MTKNPTICKFNIYTKPKHSTPIFQLQKTRIRSKSWLQLSLECRQVCQNFYLYFELAKPSSRLLGPTFSPLSWEFCKRHLVTLGSNLHVFLLISLQSVHFYLERFNISNSLIKDNSSVHVIITRDYISQKLDHSFYSLFFGFLGRSRFP